MRQMNDFKDEIVYQLERNKNENNQTRMEAYMKHYFPFYGIKSPELKKLLKPIFDKNSRISETKRFHTARLLFQEEHRECHYAALSLLEEGINKSPLSAIGFYKELLMTKPWWDSIDMISTKLCGSYFKRFPCMLEPITEDWKRSSHMWVRRSSILHQLKFKDYTNEQLLFETIHSVKHEKEFFIEKAVGWALREYSKTNPHAVVSFLEQTEVRPLSKREALKWMKGKGMTSV